MEKKTIKNKQKGLEALKEHFKNSKFPCEMDHYLPVVFSPPREGKQLTEPFPIVGHNKHPISTGLHGSKASDDDDEMDGQDTLEEEEEEEEEEDGGGGGGGSDDFDVDQHDVLLDYSNSCSSSNSYPNGGVNGDEDDDDIDVDEDRGREERK